LAVGTVIICTIFAALCGISGTAAVTMGTIALPAMLKRKYDKRLAIGCINSGAGWGILMPPSIDMIVYALIAGESVGRLFAGGVMPTFLLLALDTVYILLRSYIQPSLAPALPKSERADWPTKFRALKSLILPFFIIAVVMGSIVSGAATPTEAAAVGVLGSVITAIINKRFTWRLLWEATQRSFITTMMVMWIIFGAYCFGATFQGIGGSQLIVSLMKYVPGDRWGAIIFFEIVIFLLAMVMGSTAIMMITLPIFLPVVKAYGFDTLWYGILFIINMEIGYMTPPFGYNLFYLKAVAPPGITMKDIYMSVIWFVLVESTGFVLVMIFPEIATWLPTVLFGKS
jgi:tripartite ATP-independent transporter DctM subunit